MSAFKVRVFELRRGAVGQLQSVPVEVPGFAVDASTCDGARDLVCARLSGDFGYAGRVRSVNHAPGGGLVAYVVSHE